MMFHLKKKRVKWFRGRREFYRFRPDLDPPFRLFPVEDVNVDV